MSLQMLDQDPFDVFEYVETLAWKCHGGTSDPANFDPVLLQSSFEKHIAALKEIRLDMSREVSNYEQECNDDEKRHWSVVSELMKNNQSGIESIEKLDKSINFVATRVVHLGGQLQEVQTPRSRAVEAKKLTAIFNELMHEFDPVTDSVTKALASPAADSSALYAAADVVLKLELIAQDLPTEDVRFDSARLRIVDRYTRVECALLDRFHADLVGGDTGPECYEEMKAAAHVLSQFHGYQRCVDLFVGECLIRVDAGGGDMFAAVATSVRLTCHLVEKVFEKVDKILGRFVGDLYKKKLEVFINAKLENTTSPEKYLMELNSLHCKATDLIDTLSAYQLNGDTRSILVKQTAAIFAPHIDRYLGKECAFVAKWCSTTLERYYDGLCHVKKSFQSGGMNIFKRDIQAALKSNIENYGGETFLSQDVAISILQLTRQAYERCKQLSPSKNLATNAGRIFQIVLQHLVVDHCEYAIDLGLQAIPYADSRLQPEIYFFRVISNTNTIVHLFEKQFSDSLRPCLITHPLILADCQRKKKDAMSSIEIKLDLGLERCINAIAGWIKTLLATKKGKNDFLIVGNDILASSPACGTVTQYIGNIEKEIRYGIDGKNLDNFFLVLGRYLHLIIFEHILSFQYSQTGSMLVICDVNEYRRAIETFKCDAVTKAFDTLHSLCNLMLMIPSNLETILAGYDLHKIDGSVIHEFLKLREDYKTIDIATLKPYLTNRGPAPSQQQSSM